LGYEFWPTDLVGHVGVVLICSSSRESRGADREESPRNCGCVGEHCDEDDGTDGNAKGCCAMGEKTFESDRSCGIENGICGQEIVAATSGDGKEEKWAYVKGAEQSESGASYERDEPATARGNPKRVNLIWSV